MVDGHNLPVVGKPDYNGIAQIIYEVRGATVPNLQLI